MIQVFCIKGSSNSLLIFVISEGTFFLICRADFFIVHLLEVLKFSVT